MSKLKVEKTSLEGVLLITPPTISEDFRGTHVELYNRQLYQAAGMQLEFIQDNISSSSRHVLRGLHGDTRTWKLISCLYGKLFLAVVNWDPQSPQYRQHASFMLSDQNHLQVLVPPQFANGHLVLSETAIFSYKQTTYYDRQSQFTVMWNDPALQIWWPVKDPILSRRDQGLDEDRGK